MKRRGALLPFKRLNGKQETADLGKRGKKKKKKKKRGWVPKKKKKKNFTIRLKNNSPGKGTQSAY